MIGIFTTAYTGGVLRYNCNLLEKFKVAHVESKLIVPIKNYNEKIEFNNNHSEIAAQCLFFKFNSNNNLHYTAKKFDTFLKSNNIEKLIVNDSFELQLLQIAKVKIKTIFILHGDYDHYYNTAIANIGIIDLFVCVSRQIESKLLLLNNELNTVLLGPYVPAPNLEIIKNSEATTITFIGRPDDSKGFHVIMNLVKRTQEIERPINWNIILGGEYKDLDNFPNVNYQWNIENKKVQGILASSDIFILPSRAEGFPISVVEALFYENICITSDLEVFKDIIQQHNIGYVVHDEDVDSYWRFTLRLISSVDAKNDMIQKIRNFDWRGYLFNEPSFLKLLYIKDLKDKPSFFTSQKLGILDNKYVPNLITFLLRKYVK